MTTPSPIDILVTVPFSDVLRERLQNISPYLNIIVQPVDTADDISEESWARAEILYTDRVLPEPLMAKSLKWVQLHCSGADLLQRSAFGSEVDGVVFTTLSGAVSSSVAEYVVMTLLSLGRQLPVLIQPQVQAEELQVKQEHYTPVELRDSVVGIVGYGSIGREIARLLQPFGCTVLATKRDAMNPVDNGYCIEGLGDPNGDLIQRLYPAEALHSMLRECDLVVVAVPSIQTTHHLIDEGALGVLKNTAYLVNVSRGNVIDETALLNALQQQRLAGAALDALPEETLTVGRSLWELSNVIITPHIAGESALYHARAMDLFIDNCKRYMAGQVLYNQVDLKRGY
jgi:phosphoglycerate dehydrogenase-like enzyme